MLCTFTFHVAFCVVLLKLHRKVFFPHKATGHFPKCMWFNTSQSIGKQFHSFESLSGQKFPVASQHEDIVKWCLSLRTNHQVGLALCGKAPHEQRFSLLDSPWFSTLPKKLVYDFSGFVAFFGHAADHLLVVLRPPLVKYPLFLVIENTIAANSTDERNATLAESIFATIARSLERKSNTATTSPTLICLARVTKGRLAIDSFKPTASLRESCCVHACYVQDCKFKTFGHQTSWCTPVNVLYFLTCTCIASTRSEKVNILCLFNAYGYRRSMATSMGILSCTAISF